MNTVLYIALVLASMGAFDTLYFHEYKLQLPKTKTAVLELRLHAARDFVYAVLFFSLGWLEWHGAFAVVFAALILIEVGITQWDFIEEDMSRKLPKGERVMHSLMGIVYGILLATFAPILWDWWSEPTGFARMDHRWMSWAMLAMAAGVFMSGVRDLWSSMQMKSRAAD
jgi:uncharacterized protein